MFTVNVLQISEDNCQCLPSEVCSNLSAFLIECTNAFLSDNFTNPMGCWIDAKIVGFSDESMADLLIQTLCGCYDDWYCELMEK